MVVENLNPDSYWVCICSLSYMALFSSPSPCEKETLMMIIISNCVAPNVIVIPNTGHVKMKSLQKPKEGFWVPYSSRP
ncbi:hypothetical protein RJT34_06285 [Clitoria ternatea]|uniref:Uncharacterized protein n=1 Tax=Clitoria ternatea TaxID=43366 RepID=A0AAN9K5H3_CLITE